MLVYESVKFNFLFILQLIYVFINIALISNLLYWILLALYVLLYVSVSMVVPKMKMIFL